MNTRRPSSGFTLPELLVTVAIIGILAAAAVPSFRSLIQSQQIKSASFELYASLNVARSEAIKRNNTVTVTPGNPAAWQAGWTIADSSGAFVKKHDALKGVVVTLGPASLAYSYTGRITGVAPMFQIDAGTGTTATVNVRCIKIDLSGMPRTLKGACA